VPSYYDVGTIVLGGDLSGKAIVPVVEHEDGWEVLEDGSSQVVTDEDEVETIEKGIADNGNYPARMTPTELEEFRADTDLVDEKYRELRLERLDRWVEWTEDKLGDTDVELYVIGGNDDHDYMVDRLREASVFDFVEDRVVEMRDGFELLGYGWANPTPWDTPREKPDEEIATDLERIADDVEDWQRTILNVHCPPHGTEIDSAPKLDENLKPETSGGEVVTEPVGSRAVRRFVEDHQPLLSLHGHIHESQGEVRVGETTCLNPGSDYSSGYLSGATVTLAETAVREHQFTSG
jgi:Icc-related predicted phosphoesterase